MGLVIASVIFFFCLIYGYFALRYLLTGEPGPFDTVHYDDDLQPNTYYEIEELLKDKYGPTVVFHINFVDYKYPTCYQEFLIQKSKEIGSKLKIEVHT